MFIQPEVPNPQKTEPHQEWGFKFTDFLADNYFYLLVVLLLVVILWLLRKKKRE
ncbi:MAG: LPXTG cell wall anchor domain-containing protein [Flavobacteriaceae bacterium]|nr:LPXTG cell wall anchor domain-containing protein [Flavobacteriaceae bacterium]